MVSRSAVGPQTGSERSNNNLAESPEWRLPRGSQLLKRSSVYSATIVSTATTFDRILSLQSSFHLAVAVTKRQGLTACLNRAFKHPIVTNFPRWIQAIAVTKPIHTETISAPQTRLSRLPKGNSFLSSTALCSP